MPRRIDINEIRCNHCAELEAEVENLVWNLGGCSTYALGYDLDKTHSVELARPALNEVKNAMLRKKEIEAKLSKAVEALETIKGYYDLRERRKWHKKGYIVACHEWTKAVLTEIKGET